MTGKRLLKKSAKITGYVIGVLLIVVIILFAFINTNYGKKVVKNRIVTYLTTKFKTKVSISSIDYRLPQWVELKGVYIEDQHKDTLLYGEQMAFDLDMFGLMRGVTYIHKVEFKNMYANLYRTGNDTAFNFDFVVNAFKGKPAPNAIIDTTPLKLTLDLLSLNRVRINFKDDYVGNSFMASVNNLEATLNKFQPDRLQFGIDKFDADTVNFIMTTVKGTHVDTSTAVQTGNSLVLTSGLSDLRNVNVWIDDKTTGMHYDNTIRHLNLTDGSINLYSQKILANKVLLDSSAVNVALPQPVANGENDSTVTEYWNIALNELQMKNNQFKLDDNSIASKGGLDPSHLDLSNIFVKTKKIQYTLDSSSAVVEELSFKDKSSFSVDSSHANFLYTKNGLSATNLYLKTPNSIVQNTLEIKYDNIDQLKTAPENSSISVSLVNSRIAVNDLYLLMPSVKKYMSEAKFRNNYVNLNTQMQGNFQRLNIPFLQLVSSSGSHLNARATLYNVADPNKLSYDIFVYNSSLVRTDIAKFLPDDKRRDLNKLPPVINLTSHFTGDMKKTNSTVDVSGNNFRFVGQGNIQNLENPNTLKYDVNIKEGRMTKDFITAFMPPNSIPESISLPDQILLSGTAKGDMNNIESNMKLGGSYGTAIVKGSINNFKNTEATKYNVQITTDGFELGKFLKNDSIIGRMSLTGSANGRGLNYKTMSAEINSTISAIEFKHYTYQNIDLHAALNNGNIKTEGTIYDPAIKMKYDIAASVKNQYPSNVEATLSIDTLLLGRLNLVKDTMSIAGEVYINAPDLDPKHVNLLAVMDSMDVNIRDKNYLFDSIVAKANTTDSGNVVSFRSQLADLDAKGHFEYDKVGQSLIQYIDAHYNITDAPPQTIAPQEIAFEGNLKKHPLITDLIPGLVYDSIYFKGDYASDHADSALNFFADVPYLQYQSTIVNKSKVVVSSKNNSINGDINFDKMNIGGNVLYATTIQAAASDDSLSVTGITKDEKDNDRFAVGTIVTAKSNTYNLSLKDTLLLDYQKWNVAPNNKITYSPEGILIRDFVLSNNAQKISAASRGNNLNSPIDVEIENFNIKDITSILNSDTLLASGLINGKFTLSQFTKTTPSFTGNVEVSKFELMQQPIGTVKIFAERKEENVVHATVDLSENGNVASIKGDYYLNNEQQQFDADFNITSLNVATLQAFTGGNITRASGSINGDIAISGKFSDPRWKGAIGFDSTKFTVAKTGTSYAIDKQRVIFDYPIITFDNFTIKDSASHPLVVNGTMRSKALMDYDLALDVNANDFILINTSQSINDQLYGYAAVDVNVSLTGSSTTPDIEGDISVNDISNITMVLPEQNINKDAARSIVRFIDRDTFALPEKIAFSPAVEPGASFAQFLNYNLNIEVSKKASLTVIIDPTTGDQLKVQGDAQLNAGVDPGGHLVLVGNYILDKGSYVFNYQFIQRQFNLLPGSTITFAGEPMDAQIDISAEYVVNTSAKDLLGNEVGEVDPKVSNTFNQKIPFHVLLYLKGAMKKPEITFDIQLPDENTVINSQLRTTIENKLTQLRGDATATNKQVFSLLLLNRFAGEQSTDFFRGTGESPGDIARESVSQLLSSALDQIVGDIFKGVDVDLNINSYKDYSSGDVQQKTDFTVAVTKSFLDDRLTISVGKNFGLEGDETTAKAQQKSNSYLPDVTLNYKLTKDGKYMLRAYRKDEYEVILDGYVVETGVAFILTLDYDKFKELFWKK